MYSSIASRQTRELRIAVNNTHLHLQNQKDIQSLKEYMKSVANDKVFKQTTEEAVMTLKLP